MANKPGSRLVSGTTEVATAQTAVRLSTTKLEGTCLGVYISIDPNAVGATAAVGDKNVNAKATLGTFKGMILEKKTGPVFIEIADPSELWVDAVTSKDFVTWTALLA
jgi:hypothetical protein